MIMRGVISGRHRRPRVLTGTLEVIVGGMGGRIGAHVRDSGGRRRPAPLGSDRRGIEVGVGLSVGTGSVGGLVEVESSVGCGYGLPRYLVHGEPVVGGHVVLHLDPRCHNRKRLDETEAESLQQDPYRPRGGGSGVLAAGEAWRVDTDGVHWWKSKEGRLVQKINREKQYHISQRRLLS